MITVFLDESGIHADSEQVLVGAVVTPDVKELEAQLVKVHSDVLADDMHWNNYVKRGEFETQGFHHCEDSESVRGAFVGAMRKMDFRAHVVFSRRESGVEDVDLLLNMYYVLIRNILIRYQTVEVLFVFENESRLDNLYSRIVEIAREDLKHVGVANVCIGKKTAPVLAVVDYTLALVGIGLSGEKKEIQQFKLDRVKYGMAVHLAHLFDFDKQAHKSARKGIELV